MSPLPGLIPGYILFYKYGVWWLVLPLLSFTSAGVDSFLALLSFAKDMIRNVVDRVWGDGEGFVPVVLPPYPSQYFLPEPRDILTDLNTSSDSSNKSCMLFIHESEALNVVSASDTGKVYINFKLAFQLLRQRHQHLPSR